MRIKIEYSKTTQKFLKRNSAILTKEKARRLLIKAVKKIILKEDVNIDIKILKGNHSGLYRIRHRKTRIIFAIQNGKIIIVNVTNIDFRGDVY